ncbi:MAG: hypothetical protein TR69_WS6001001412 [candidate division WS6 bacterium OLB20]|uniref:HTH arsR-type domain-containing protein n=1 Tax=candidate division WS6 bacterium OLB20 TaxID=1617426 RepID=A0A136LVY6_9BACT|nr:MAG: hypothetical protein TR69_WS6001001412 [candidate division WS6 bacterium OLB20]
MAKLTKSLNYLFISKVRIKCIKYFLFNPDVPIHLRGAVRELKEEINAVRRELTRLEEISYIKAEVRGNRKYFSLNYEYDFLNELLGMFHKTFGLGGALRSNEAKLGDIQFAVLTDAYIKGNRLGGQDVDLVVVGQVDLNVLGEIVDEAEKKLGREINYTVLKGSEFVLRKKRRDAFVTELLIRDKVVVIGNSSDLAN